MQLVNTDERSMWKTLLGWSAAVVTTAVSGSLVQSQINLAAISGLGQSIPAGERVSLSLFDLGSFAPVWGAIVAFSFLFALPVSGWLARRWPDARRWLFPLAGFVAVLASLIVMDAMLPVTVVAAARSLSGVLLMALCGALGGWVYLQVTAQPSQRQNGRI